MSKGTQEALSDPTYVMIVATVLLFPAGSLLALGTHPSLTALQSALTESPDCWTSFADTGPVIPNLCSSSLSLGISPKI